MPNKYKMGLTAIAILGAVIMLGYGGTCGLNTNNEDNSNGSSGGVLPALATTPVPNSGASNVAVGAQLSWATVADAISYDVYFGATSPGAFIGNQTGTTYNPGTLAYSTTYYWRVDSKNATGTTAGNVWSFSTVAAMGVAVDPYISGAQFFEDLDNDGIKDIAEQVSSLSDANGVFTFPASLTQGSIITFNPAITSAMHNGVAFAARIRRTVDTITGTLVTSPLTTLLANGWTELEVVNCLTQAGLTGITVTDLTKDPMEGIALLDYTVLTETHLVNIRASIAIYSFLSIMDGIINNGFAISYTAFTQNPNAIPLLQRMVNMINTGLSVQVLNQIKQGMDIAANYLAMVGKPPPPPVTAGDIIQASVAVANFIIPQVIADINYAPNLVQCALLSQKLGRSFYLLRNKADQTIQMGMSMNLNNMPQVGNATTFVVNADGTDAQGQ